MILQNQSRWKYSLNEWVLVVSFRKVFAGQSKANWTWLILRKVCQEHVQPFRKQTKAYLGRNLVSADEHVHSVLCGITILWPSQLFTRLRSLTSKARRLQCRPYKGQWIPLHNNPNYTNQQELRTPECHRGKVQFDVCTPATTWKDEFLEQEDTRNLSNPTAQGCHQKLSWHLRIENHPTRQLKYWSILQSELQRGKAPWFQDATDWCTERHYFHQPISAAKNNFNSNQLLQLFFFFPNEGNNPCTVVASVECITALNTPKNALTVLKSPWGGSAKNSPEATAAQGRRTEMKKVQEVSLAYWTCTFHTHDTWQGELENSKIRIAAQPCVDGKVNLRSFLPNSSLCLTAC